MTMSQDAKRAHFVFIPLMAQGHLIPVIDTAFLLCTRGALCSIMATPATAARVRPCVEQSGLEVRLVEFPLEYVADGADNLDNIAPARMMGYFKAVSLLAAPIEEYLRTHAPPVTCIVSDLVHPWTSKVAASLGVPRITFLVMSAFCALWEHKANLSSGEEDLQEAVVAPPGMGQRYELRRSQCPSFFRQPEYWGTLGKEIDQAMAESDGIVVNTFLELEPDFVRGLADAWKKKVWTVGPVSLHHRLSPLPGTSRGETTAIDSDECLQWLDGKEPGSVVYVNFGTISKRMQPQQILELGLGLQMSGHPFIWVLSKTNHAELPLLQQHLQLQLQAGQGRIVTGWVPQLLILCHAAVGCFLTHCGWNSILETITAGTPVVTWPRLPGSDHYVGERLAVDVLGIGLSIAPTDQDDEEALVRREVIQGAVTSVLDAQQPDANERRRRARALADDATAAMQLGGSSDVNLCDLANRFAI